VLPLSITEPPKIAEMTPDQSQGGHRERHQGRVNELRSVYTAFVNLRQQPSTTLTNAAAAAAETIIATNSGPSASAGARFKPMLQLQSMLERGYSKTHKLSDTMVPTVPHQLSRLYES